MTFNGDPDGGRSRVQAAKMINCASIVVAAGASSRLGKPKQLLQMGGESLLRRTARLAVEAGCSPNMVVLGKYADVFTHELDGLAVETVINAGWSEGMGSSLRCAMRLLRAGQSPPDRVLLLVCDQPHVTADLLRSLIAHHVASKDGIVASRYGGGLGVPAVFGSSFFAELAELSGDRGAHGVIAQHAAETSYLDFPDGGFDVDTPADESVLQSLPVRDV